jgi:hypothetical protein
VSEAKVEVPLYDAAKVEEWRARAKQYLADPDILENDLDEGLLLLLQVQLHAALNPTEGVDGLRISLQAAKDYRDMADTILRARRGPGDEDEEGEGNDAVEGVDSARRKARKSARGKRAEG